MKNLFEIIGIKKPILNEIILKNTDLVSVKHRGFYLYKGGALYKIKEKFLNANTSEPVNLEYLCKIKKKPAEYTYQQFGELKHIYGILKIKE
jgi:hypothetical protein